MFQSSAKSLVRVNSSLENSLYSCVFIHAMTTIVHLGDHASVKHSAQRHNRGWRIVSYARCPPILYGFLCKPGILKQCLLGLLISLITSGPAQSSEPAAVAVASSLRSLWPSLISSYQDLSGNQAPRTSFASSGLLTTQIRHGAPFELFLSADPGYVKTLEQSGKTKGKGIAFASGRLSLLVPKTSAIANKLTLGNLQLLFAGTSEGTPELSSEAPRANSNVRITIPNPVHAPYGMAARQFLINAGIWPLEPHQLLAAENAAQTLQFVLTGAVDVAIVPSVLIKNLSPGLTSMSLPADSHDPVIHHMVLLESASDEAMQLYDWLQSDVALNILTDFGFGAPP
ncbi:MAG: molybdate ABC transporter substrate-binding protein [Granulosicoccus sp.]